MFSDCTLFRDDRCRGDFHPGSDFVILWSKEGTSHIITVGVKLYIYHSGIDYTLKYAQTFH